VLRSEHTAQEFVKIDEWTRPAGISCNGNIGPKVDRATRPATYRETIRKSPDRAGLGGCGRPPQFCHWSLRPRFAFNHAATTEVTSRIPRTLSAALGDDFRDVRAVEFSPLVLRTIGHDFRRTGNALSTPDALLATFVPVNGCRDENEAGAKSWNATARKVGTGRTGPNCKSRSRAGSFRYGGSDGAASAARSFDLIGSQPSPAWVQRNSVNC
jgi:hypothetical protein